MIKVIILITIGVILLIILSSIGIMFEKRDFNNGICPHCNNKLRNFDTDSQGGRGYKCDCGYHTWVSYNCVDKNFYLKS